MKHGIIGDIHGRYDLLLNVIARLEYNGFVLGKDTLVCVGDYIDRGKQGKQVVEYLSMLKKEYGDKIVLLKGNHELLAEQAYNGIDNDFTKWWLNTEGIDTIECFGDTGVYATLLPFIKDLKLYYETADFICVHGGIPEGFNLQTATEQDLLWNRDNDHYRGKRLVVGHEIVDRVIQREDTLYINTDSVGGALSAVILPDMKVVTTNGATQRKIMLDKTFWE